MKKDYRPLLSALLFYGLVFVTAFLLRYNGLESESIWMDEDMQAGRSLNRMFDASLVDKAAEQQQPPLDYFAQAIGLHVFGVTPTGARIHAVVFGALAAVLFSLMLRCLFLRFSTVLFGSAVFCFFPLLIRYSQEGRPIACGVFFATLYLYLVASRILQSSGSQSRTGVAIFLVFNAFLLFFAQAGFLLSIGFQPLIFLAVSCTALTPLIFFKNYRLKILVHHVSSVAAFFWVYPLLKRTIAGDPTHIKGDELFEILRAMFANIELPSVVQAVGKIETLLGESLIPWAAISLLGAVAIAWTLISRRKKYHHYFPVFYSGLLVVLFAALFDIVFYSVINYRVTLRYYLTLTPALLFFGIALWDAQVSFVFGLKDRSRNKPAAIWKSPVGIGLTLAACLIIFLQIYVAITTVYGRQENAGWKDLYALLNENKGTHGRAYMMNLTKIDRYHPYFFSRQFYYAENPNPVPLYKSNMIPTQYDKVGYEELDKVFLCAMYGYKKIRPSYFQNLRGVKVHHFTTMSVIEVGRHDGMRKQILRVFRSLGHHLRVSEDNYLPFSILHRLEHYESNQQAMTDVREKMKSMNKRGKLTRLIATLKRESREQSVRE